MAFTDDFTGTENQQLSDRSGWTLITDGRDAKINASNQLKLGGGTPASDAAYSCTDQGSANHYTQVDYHASGSNASFVAVRLTDEDNFIGFRYYNTGWQVYKCVTGSFTQLGSTYVDTPTAGDTMKLEADGNTITLYLNDVSIISETESFNNTETTQGIVVRDASAIDPFLDNFEAGPVSAGASIDTADTPILDGEQNNAFTVSGFGSAITSAKLVDVATGNYEYDASSSLAGTYTYDYQDVANLSVDTLGTPFDSASHTHNLEVSDGTDTATTTVVINPAIGYEVIEVASAVKTKGSVFENFIGSILDTCQVLYPTANNTSVDATGILATDQLTGTISMVFYDISDYKWKPFTVIVSQEGTSIIGFYSLAANKMRL